MRMGLRLSLGLCALSLACQGRQQERSSSAPVASPNPSHDCAPQRGEPCLADELPRVTAADWSDAQIAHFLSLSQFGRVAVDRQGAGSPAVQDECRLGGHYVEVRGQSGLGRFWGTERSLLPPAEVPVEGCDRATHVVGAYALKRASVAGRDLELAAVLVALPCPSIRDDRPAPGCVGRGLTGSERHAAAERLAGEYRGLSPLEPARRLRLVLDIMALAPDDGPLLGSLDWSPFKAGTDHMTRELLWLVGENESLAAFRREREQNSPGRRERPQFFTRSQAHAPPFLHCFPSLFLPQPSPPCWQACSCPGVSQLRPEY